MISRNTRTVSKLMAKLISNAANVLELATGVRAGEKSAMSWRQNDRRKIIADSASNFSAVTGAA